MMYTEAKSCPLCQQCAAVPSNHRCQDYYDKMGTYTTHTLFGDNSIAVTLTKTEYRASISLDLMMDIYVALKGSYEHLKLAEQLKEELEVE